jgi:hypothetical protein
MSKIVPKSSKGLGNTKQVPPARRWCFTLHKYTEEDIQDIIDSSNRSTIEYFFSKEVGKSGETPHLQGFISWSKGKKGRPFNIFKNNTIHFEKMKGTVEQNIVYCSKEGTEPFTNIQFPTPIKYLSLDTLYPYQQEILDMVVSKSCVDDRHIYWYVGDKNIGKSALLKLLCGLYKTYILPSTKRHALSQVASTHSIIDNYVFNLTADKSEYQTNEFFDILECLKDGLFSTSFGTDNNSMCITNDKLIIVMANNPPDWNKTNIDKNRIIIKGIYTKDKDTYIIEQDKEW